MRFIISILSMILAALTVGLFLFLGLLWAVRSGSLVTYTTILVVHLLTATIFYFYAHRIREDAFLYAVTGLMLGPVSWPLLFRVTPEERRRRWIVHLKTWVDHDRN